MSELSPETVPFRAFEQIGRALADRPNATRFQVLHGVLLHDAVRITQEHIQVSTPVNCAPDRDVYAAMGQNWADRAQHTGEYSASQHTASSQESGEKFGQVVLDSVGLRRLEGDMQPFYDTLNALRAPLAPEEMLPIDPRSTRAACLTPDELFTVVLLTDHRVRTSFLNSWARSLAAAPAVAGGRLWFEHEERFAPRDTILAGRADGDCGIDVRPVFESDIVRLDGIAGPVQALHHTLTADGQHRVAAFRGGEPAAVPPVLATVAEALGVSPDHLCIT